VIVGMRTCRQAARVAELTGGVQLPGKPKRDGTLTLSRFVDVGADFEARRAVVESVSVLFDLFDGDADGFAATGSPGEKLPTGWVVTAAKFEVEWPAEADRAALVRSHFGARRKAFNWGLAQVKADLDACRTDPGHESVDWDLGSLRWAWNRAKDTVAPWWSLIPRSAIRRGWLIWPRGCPIGSPARTAPVRAAVSASRGSSLLAVMQAGCGSPPEPCGSKMIGARSRCP
jgi:putative transposase